MPRPFLKWAGGKRQLLDELRGQVMAARPFGRYHEPFVGGGALFFDLYRRKLLGRKQAYLSDNNVNLMDVYTALREEPDAIIRLLAKHKAAHSKEHYYAVRAAVPGPLAARAARIIYLNRTCYNGLYRENSRGLFNVPMGKYTNPPILDEENLYAVSKALKRTKLECRPFAEVLRAAKAGDLVYFDPPYHPVSETASFTAYAKGGFGADSQRELAEVFAKLKRRGVKALLSNSMTPFVRGLYAGFRIETVHARRSVNSRGDRRGAVEEALVRNY